MSRLSTSFVLGYHGCDEAVAEQVLAGKSDIIFSDRDYDWLGPGAYFWESDPLRALEWAHAKAQRGAYRVPAVIGAVIDLRNCLDLMTRQDLELVRSAYHAFVQAQQRAGLEIPKNKSARGKPEEDLGLRYLDCAVIRHLHTVLDQQMPGNTPIAPYDTVRGMFTEGGTLYPGGGFHAQTHVQIAVRKPDCIHGFFRPRPYPAL